MLAHMILLLKMSLRNQERKMMERMFKVSYESKSLRMSIANMITNEFSPNNGKIQKKRLIMTSYMMPTKGSRYIIAIQNFITSLT